MHNAFFPKPVISYLLDIKFETPRLRWSFSKPVGLIILVYQTYF